MSDLPCSCPPCFSYSGAQSCLYKENRNVRSIVVSEKKSDGDTDSFGISTLTVAQLKQEMAERGLVRSGNKSVLYARLLEYMKSKAFEDDNEQIDESDNEKVDDEDPFPTYNI